MTVQIINGDSRKVLKSLADGSVNCCVTSPPYFGLRDYGVDGQIGLEASPEKFVEEMVAVFAEVKRVLRNDGTLWLNLGDSYAGSWGARGRGKGTNASRPDLEAKHGTDAPNRHGFPSLGVKPKDLIGIPWRVAFALQADGWYLRQDIIWHKPNPMPESVTDRCTKSHEYIFMLSKKKNYFYSNDDIREPIKSGNNGSIGVVEKAGGTAFTQDGKPIRSDRQYDTIKGANKRSVWTVPTMPYREAHFATFPPDLIEPCILAGCPTGGTVLDPFGGAGTTGLVAARLQRNAVLIELNPAYAAMAEHRIHDDAPLFAGSAA